MLMSTILQQPEAVAFERGVRPVMKIVLLEKAKAVLGFRPVPGVHRRSWALKTPKGS